MVERDVMEGQVIEGDVMEADVLEEPLNRTNPRDTRRRFIRIPKELIVRLKNLIISFPSSTHNIAHTPKALA
jgi:hypothetical protein